MSKLNKLVTNYPVNLTEEEVENLSATLAPVVAACGGGGGGGTPIYYYGDDVNINISPSRVIRLTDAATAKLNQDIPTKVSDLTDSASYQTVAGMDEYLTEVEAQATYLTKSSADTLYAPLSTTADVEALKAASGDFSQYYKKNETSSKTELETEFAKYATTGEVDAIETDLETLSSTVTADYATIRYVEDRVDDLATKTDLNKKQNKLVYDYDETGAISSIDGTPLAGQGGTTYTEGNGISIDSDTISISSNYIAAITSVSGKQDELAFTYNTSNAITHINGSAIAGEGGGGTTVYEGTDGVYVEGNNIGLSAGYKTQIETVSSKLTKASADTLYAPISVTGDVNTLKSSSGNWNKVSDKLDTTAFSTVSGNFLTAHQSLDNYYTKTQVDSTFASATQLNDYLTTAQYNTDSATFLTAHQSLTNYYQKSETSGATELSNEFAKYVTSSNVTTQNTDYVMTTTGWKVLTLPGGGMTQVIHDETLTGQGNANDNKLGVAWSALSGNTIASANSAGSATSALSADNAESARYTKQLKDASKIIQISDITALQNWASSNSATWDAVSAKLGTAQYATDSATFVTSSSNTITGTKQYALTTAGWSDISLSAYLPLSGGTVSGTTIISGSDFNTLEVLRSGQTCTGTIGINGVGGMSLKIADSNSNNTQLNIAPNADMDKRFSIGDAPHQPIAYFIPAVTSTTTAGLTNDGILHIILES